MWERLKRLGVVAGWGVVAGGLSMNMLSALTTLRSDGGDFGMYYVAAEALRFSPHSDIYHLPTLVATFEAHGGCGTPPIYPYPYQPLLALLLAPLTGLSCQTASRLWLALNLGLWLAVIVAYTLRAWRRHGAPRAEFVALLILAYVPMLSGMVRGQVHLIMLVSLLAGIWLIHRDHQYVGGAILGFGVVLKYFPAILIVYYLLRGRWRAAIGAVLTTLALVAAEALIVGPRSLISSLLAGEADVRYYAAINENGNWMNELPGGPFIGYGAALVFLTVVIWLRWSKRSQLANESIGAGWSLPTMLMLSPLIWWFYLTWLVPALIVALDTVIQHARYPRSGSSAWLSFSRWWPGVSLAASYCLLLFSPWPAAGTLLLWVLCGYLYVWSAGVRWPDRLAVWRASAWAKAQPQANETVNAGVAPE